MSKVDTSPSFDPQGNRMIEYMIICKNEIGVLAAISGIFAKHTKYFDGLFSCYTANRCSAALPGG